MSPCTTMNVLPFHAPSELTWEKWQQSEALVSDSLTRLHDAAALAADPETRAGLERHAREIEPVVETLRALTASVAEGRKRLGTSVDFLFGGGLSDVFEWAASFADEACACLDGDDEDGLALLAQLTSLCAIERELHLAPAVAELRSSVSAGLLPPRAAQRLAELSVDLRTERTSVRSRSLRAVA